MNKFLIPLFALLVIIPSFASSQKFDKIDRYLFAEQYEEAIPLLESAIKKDSINYKNHFRLGKVYQNLKRYPQATASYQKAHELKPQSKSVLLSLSGSLYNMGSYPNAEKMMMKFQLLDTTNHQANILLAKIHTTQGNYAESIKVYRQILRKDSLNAFAYKQMAGLYNKLNKHIEALANYQKAYNLNPKDLSVTLHLIQSLYDMTGYAGALRYANEGLAVYPNHPLILKKKVKVLIASEWYENALTILKEMDARKQLKIQDYKQLGICYMQTKQYEAALTSFNKVLALKEFMNDPMINFYAGVCCARLHKTPEAIDHLETALHTITPPIKASIHLQLAKSFNANREFAKAVKQYKQSFDIDSKQAKVLYEIATTYEEFGNHKKEALNFYTKYMHMENNKACKNYEYAKSRVLHLKEALHFEK